MRLLIGTFRPYVLIAVTSLLGYVASNALISLLGLHWNATDSVPVGLYREVAGDTTRYAALCLPGPVLRSALNAGLKLDEGICAGGVEPILKQLIEARPDRPLTFETRGFFLVGKLLPNTAPKPVSRIGRPLFHYAFGIYTDGLWAISTYNPDSFDSRYFGPVDQTAIRFQATPVFTY